jgi:tartrate dehydratase beta subunit/fumarate hydratase class I family protein
MWCEALASCLRVADNPPLKIRGVRGVMNKRRDPERSHLQNMEAEDFPVTVINDIYGGDLYEQGKAKYQVKAS